MSTRIVEPASETIDVMPYLDNLRQLEEDPLDISHANAAELQQIPGMSAQAAYRIVTYRKSHPIESKKDLHNIEGLEPEVIEAIGPYVTFMGKTSRRNSRPVLNVRLRMDRKLSEDPASDGVRYLGAPDKVYTRIAGRFSLSPESRKSKGNDEWLTGSSLSFGLLTSKDPGEKNYADLFRWQIEANIPACSTRLVLGDYLVDGGQGLVFWRPSGFSKGGEATSGVARNGMGVWPSLSTGQSMTFRGIGVNTQQRGFGLHLFYSNKLSDAITDSAGAITHLASDDLHRTDTELAKRDRLREKTFGARATIDLGIGIKLGVSGFSSRFDESVRLSGPFGFQGNLASAYGVDGLYTDGSTSVFAEIAHDRSRAPAAIAGFSANLLSNLSVAFLFRSYSRSYNNFHSSGFSESENGCKNESGIYTGLTILPAAWLRITAYVDQFTFPWRTFSSLMTSQGHEYSVEADLRIRGNLGIGIQFRQKDKTESNDLLNVVDILQSGSESKGRTTFRATLRIDPIGSLRWQNCVEIVSTGLEHESAQERGMLFFQDLTDDIGADLSVSARIVAFQTESYESRVYEYEADLPGAYSTPALFGSGFRCYILGHYRWGQILALAVKYSLTKSEKSNAGSAGENKHVSVQLDFAL
jgi:hypothetical protein